MNASRWLKRLWINSREYGNFRDRWVLVKSLKQRKKYQEKVTKLRSCGLFLLKRLKNVIKLIERIEKNSSAPAVCFGSVGEFKYLQNVKIQSKCINRYLVPKKNGLTTSSTWHFLCHENCGRFARQFSRQWRFAS